LRKQAHNIFSLSDLCFAIKIPQIERGEKFLDDDSRRVR